MTDEKVDITCEVDELAELFEDCPGVSVQITFDEMACILNAFQAAGTFAVMTGQEPDQGWWDCLNGFKEKTQAAFQAWLDAQPRT